MDSQSAGRLGYDIGPMSGHSLPIPARLTSLLAAGLWPRNGQEAHPQNWQPLVPTERIKRFAPEENTIYLEAPPFRTVAQEAEGRAFRFWETCASLGQISPSLSLIIGDFGIGSDAPIILDYRDGYADPPVLRLRWSEKVHENSWVKCASNFDEFADLLGLDGHTE